MTNLNFCAFPELESIGAKTFAYKNNFLEQVPGYRLNWTKWEEDVARQIGGIAPPYLPRGYDKLADSLQFCMKQWVNYMLKHCGIALVETAYYGRPHDVMASGTAVKAMVNILIRHLYDEKTHRIITDNTDVYNSILLYRYYLLETKHDLEDFFELTGVKALERNAQLESQMWCGTARQHAEEWYRFLNGHSSRPRPNRPVKINPPPRPNKMVLEHQYQNCAKHARVNIVDMLPFLDTPVDDMSRNDPPVGHEPTKWAKDEQKPNKDALKNGSMDEQKVIQQVQHLSTHVEFEELLSEAPDPGSLMEMDQDQGCAAPGCSALRHVGPFCRHHANIFLKSDEVDAPEPPSDAETPTTGYIMDKSQREYLTSQLSRIVNELADDPTNGYLTPITPKNPGVGYRLEEKSLLKCVPIAQTTPWDMSHFILSFTPDLRELSTLFPKGSLRMAKIQVFPDDDPTPPVMMGYRFSQIAAVPPDSTK